MCAKRRDPFHTIGEANNHKLTKEIRAQAQASLWPRQDPSILEATENSIFGKMVSPEGFEPSTY